MFFSKNAIPSGVEGAGCATREMAEASSPTNPSFIFVRRGPCPAASPLAGFFARTAGAGAPARPRGAAPQLRLHYIISHGVAHQCRDGAEVQLVHDVGAVGFGGLDGNVEGLRDFFVALALGQQLDDLALASSQPAARRLGLAA